MADPENQVQTFAVIICCSLTLYVWTTITVFIVLRQKLPETFSGQNKTEENNLTFVHHFLSFFMSQ